MVTSLDDLLVALRSVVSTASDVPLADVILANQGKRPPKVKGLYATYNPIPVRAYGQPRKSRELTPAEEAGPEANWEDIAETVVSSLDLLLSVNFINTGSRGAAWKMHNASHRQPVRELLFNNGIAWRYAGEIRDLTSLYQASYQHRYQVDIHLYVETAITDTILRAAGFSFTVEDENGNTLYQ